ncbi:MAG: acyl-CoA dehydrogenase [Subtercola sp.]|nr:acyl-CoA dehydrogenase [Subtercola sp.]
MSASTTLPDEIGLLASESIRDMVSRATDNAPIATYAEGESPLSWQSISDGGWDQIGIIEDGEGASLRDLVEIARAWGESCIPLPLLPTIMAKRHSAAARAVDGPVTIAIPSATRTDGTCFVPYGQLGDIVVATGLDAGTDCVVPVTDGLADDFDILMHGVQAHMRTDMSMSAARELGVVFAAEASGAAKKLLNDGIVFAKEREQFGKPIGSFQAVKHHLANALINAELAETAVIWSSLQEHEVFRGALFAIDRSIAVGELVLQVHGGLGFTWEMGLHFYLRRMLGARELVSGLSSEFGGV